MNCQVNPLQVWTARINTSDPDAYDITWKSGDRTFAPSWKILRPVLDARKEGRVLSNIEWHEYAGAYVEEMRGSLRAHPDAWAALLARPRAVLTCYCTNPKRCHRTLLGLMLGRLGATFHGEVDELARARAQFDEMASLDDDTV